MEAGRRAGPRTGASEQNRLELDPGPGHEGGRNAEAWGGGLPVDFEKEPPGAGGRRAAKRAGHWGESIPGAWGAWGGKPGL